MTPEAFVQQLRYGQSPAAIAKSQGKTSAGLEQALLQGAQKRIAAEVQSGRLTAAQAASVQQRLPSHIHRFVSSGWHHADPAGPLPAPAPAAQP
jgi:hypothetical protein